MGEITVTKSTVERYDITVGGKENIWAIILVSEDGQLFVQIGETSYGYKWERVEDWGSFKEYLTCLSNLEVYTKLTNKHVTQVQVNVAEVTTRLGKLIIERRRGRGIQDMEARLAWENVKDLEEECNGRQVYVGEMALLMRELFWLNGALPLLGAIKEELLGECLVEEEGAKVFSVRVLPVLRGILKEELQQ